MGCGDFLYQPLVKSLLDWDTFIVFPLSWEVTVVLPEVCIVYTSWTWPERTK